MAQNSIIDKLTSSRLEEIALDYIVNGKKQAELQDKYNLSKYLISSIVKEMKLAEKRKKYREKLLEKSLERCSTYQSKIIYRATEILNKHIEKISEQQKSNEKYSLSSSEVRDVMAILQIVSKENRLDNDKPTDKLVKEVIISFPEGFSPITHKPDIIVEANDAQEKMIKEATVEEAVEEVLVEIDEGVLENPLG